MLIPMADVPRWYAERKPKDTVAISHGADTLTWEQLERGANRRARAFAAKGVKAGDFVAIGLPNGNTFFETTFAVWKLGATPTSLSWRLPRGEAAAVLDILKPALVVGGEADWNAPNSVPANFTPEGVSDEPINSPVARYWKAMTSGGSTGRPKVILDHGPAVVETAADQMLGIPRDVSLLNPGPLYHNAPFILSHMGLFAGGRLTGMVKFDAEEVLRLIAANQIHDRMLCDEFRRKAVNIRSITTAGEKSHRNLVGLVRYPRIGKSVGGRMLHTVLTNLKLLLHAPTSLSSKSSQIVWPIVMCISCIRGVDLQGTHKQRSHTARMRPPVSPVRPMTVTSHWRAASTARRIFGLLPLVDIASSTSPGRACAVSSRANTCSYP